MFRRARPCLFCKGLVYSLHLWNRILHTALFPKLTPRPDPFGAYIHLIPALALRMGNHPLRRSCMVGVAFRQTGGEEHAES